MHEVVGITCKPTVGLRDEDSEPPGRDLRRVGVCYLVHAVAAPLPPTICGLFRLHPASFPTGLRKPTAGLPPADS